ncbi:Phosphoglycerate mutase family 5 [Fructilactobacillus florum 8D]|uniref:Phosphoglycerate mutase family 5 n=2 Tax=Fructilactobacillus florum TaxID=640331 RepID=W9EJX7_9LACO|nr:histidine phosphatase family protein [Fructilactobacillus florum]EKK20303.1 Phosphoglycerate mutase family 5 [Fructilactobacillus florum 2F]ETO39984.1 Phosphoglycerate mutase family 5 [Fructilactobacillus florum 8D]KRM91662.1 hypothetical protein FC87_GL000799 [Fructilactobacillus florum DSM 22689 = JCM 16035]
MRLYFIRHGKTTWNLESRYQGAGGDSPLLATSYSEIRQAGFFLREQSFAHVYASPIKRARVTASKLLTAMNVKVPLSLDNRLEEFHLGQLEGMKFTDAAAAYPQVFDNFRNHPDQYDPTEIGGESYAEVVARMRQKIFEITANFENSQQILLVSHGAALTALINSLLQVPMADWRKRGGLGNTSTTILETLDHGQTFSLIAWNQTNYLNRPLETSDLI